MSENCQLFAPIAVKEKKQKIWQFKKKIVFLHCLK